MDVVTCWHVIEHVADPRGTIQEMYRVLRPGGVLLGYVGFLESFQESSSFHVSHRGLEILLTKERIARRATDPFSSLCVFGIAALFFTHIFENIGMTINLMPITGIPLPFFSYGGSFLLACSIGIGIALRVAWESRQSGYGESGQ